MEQPRRIALNLVFLMGLMGPSWAQSPVARPTAPPVTPIPSTANVIPLPDTSEKSLTYEDFAHANRGCPENSECDEVMGKLLQQWKQLTTRWAELPAAQKLKEMQEHLKKHGWPVEFYTKTAAKSGLNPAFYSSPCPHHNPKDAPLNRIWKGLAFLKGMEAGQIIASRGDTEFKLKPSELLYLQPVYVLTEGRPAEKYLLPLDERPIFLEKGKLRVLVESEDQYVILGVGLDGPWEVQLPPEEGLSAYFDDREEVACPADAPKPEAPWFQKGHCQKIMNKDTGKTVIAQFFWAC